MGEHDEPEEAKGSREPLAHEGETVGAALRTRDGVRADRLVGRLRREAGNAG